MVVTKDRDFRDDHLLRSTPRRLLLVVTGNITNDDLSEAFDRHLAEVVSALDDAAYVELASDRLIVHGDR